MDEYGTLEGVGVTLIKAIERISHLAAWARHLARITHLVVSQARVVAAYLVAKGSLKYVIVLAKTMGT
jgi:hypothetical protein